MYKDINARLKKIREDLCNDSNIEFANKINVSRQAANNYVREGYNVGKSVIDQISKAFPNISLAWLLSGEGNMFKADTASRIKEIMTYYDLRTTQFAERTGITQANLSSMLNGNRVIGEGVINKIVVSFENINKHWLLTGEGCMFKEPADSSEYTVPGNISVAAEHKADYGHKEPTYQDRYIRQLEAENKRLIKLVAEKDEIIEGMKNGTIIFVSSEK